MSDILQVKVNGEWVSIPTIKGEKGDTPVKGVDYFTQSDINEISSQIGSTKQDTLVSGTNIKTINSLSLLGSGNLDIDGVTDYTELTNKPSINNVTLSGNKSLSDLGINIPSLTGYATESWVENKGYITSVPDNTAFLDTESETTSADPRDADTLDGHPSSYYGTAEQVSSLNSNIGNKANASDLTNLSNSVYKKGASKNIATGATGTYNLSSNSSTMFIVGGTNQSCYNIVITHVTSDGTVVAMAMKDSTQMSFTTAKNAISFKHNGTYNTMIVYPLVLMGNTPT